MNTKDHLLIRRSDLCCGLGSNGDAEYASSFSGTCSWASEGAQSTSLATYTHTGSCAASPPPPSPPPPSPLPPSPPQPSPPPPTTSPPPVAGTPPPVASPPPLPPLEAGQAVQRNVEVELVAAGTVESFDDTKKNQIAESFASQLAGVSVDDVTVVVTSASVRITVTIATTTASAATSIQSSLSSSLSTASAATAFLGSAVTVTAAPVVAVNTVVVVGPPPPSPPPSSSGGISVGVIIVIAVGALGGITLLCICAYVLNKPKPRAKMDPLNPKKGANKGITKGMVAGSMIEMGSNVDSARPNVNV